MSWVFYGKIEKLKGKSQISKKLQMSFDQVGIKKGDFRPLEKKRSVVGGRRLKIVTVGHWLVRKKILNLKIDRAKLQVRYSFMTIC